jgi:pimeloyl-ACP methyl ester carboxylesterase
MKGRNMLKITSISITIAIFILLAVYIIMDVENIPLNDEQRSDLPGQFVELSNGMVHYQFSGAKDAPIVVLVHGFSVPYYVWDPTYSALADAGFRVLRYDLYGRGFSDRPDVPYDLALFITQLEQLLNVLEINDPISLVGLSYGGPIVTGFANQYPDKVKSITLVSPQISTVTTKDIFPLNIPIVGEYLMAVYVAPIALPNAQEHDFHTPKNYPDWKDRYLIQTQYKGFRKAILSSIRCMVGQNVMQEYEAIVKKEYPVSLLWGQEDQTILANEIDKIQLVIPDLEFHSIEEAGHLVHFEKSEIVNPVLIDFLLRADTQDLGE